MRRVLALLVLFLSLAAGASVLVTGRGTADEPARVRHYYIQAENADWTLVPTGYYDDKLGRQVAPEKTRFPAIVLRGYTDPAFTEPLPRPPWMGILGPTIEARVGDRILVHFRNRDFGYGRPHSLHVHGLTYGIAHDGGWMPDLTPPQPGTAVQPGAEYTYEWEAGPSSAGTWFYHDHSVDAADNVRRGMLGGVIVRAPDERPADREYVLLFSAFPRPVTRLRRDFFTINGVAFMGGLSGLGARVGERVRFRVIGMGDEFHTFHLHGHRWTLNGQVVDNVPIAPASTATFEFVEDAPGFWMLHCHVLEHTENGMMQHYLVTAR
jgi:FtsP/CotA-like multicopper oxidase with cupredoxin domain